jgi:hypothetical protein
MPVHDDNDGDNDGELPALPPADDSESEL